MRTLLRRADRGRACASPACVTVADAQQPPPAAPQRAAQSGLRAAGEPARDGRPRRPSIRHRAEQIRRYEDNASAAGRTRPSHGARPQHRLRGPRLLLAVRRPAAAMRPAQQPDPADARQPRSHARRSRSACKATPPTAKASAARSSPRSAQNDCGPQYRSTPTRRRSGAASSKTCSAAAPIITPGTPPASQRRHLSGRCACAPATATISRSPTRPRRQVPEDEKICQRMCPAAEVALYTHRNPGEDITQAISTGGRTIPNCRMRSHSARTFNAACSCRRPGQSWAEALKHLDDSTVERGDIVVTEERAKLLSQPRVDARGKAASGAGKGAPAQAGTAPAAGRLRRHGRPTAKRPSTTASARCAPSARPSSVELTFGARMRSTLHAGPMTSKIERLALRRPLLSLSSARSGCGSAAPESRKRLTIG